MNCSLYKKLSFSALIIGSMFLSSCGSSGGGDEEYDFKSSDLTYKAWYVDSYLSSNYSEKDALIVYTFEGGEVLKRQEYSGKRESVVGEWSLNEKKLIIEDRSISENDHQEWLIQSSSKANYLF